MNLSTYWRKVPVTLYRGPLNLGTPVPPESDPYLRQIPIYARSVSVVYNIQENYQFGNPKDWITRIPKGGTLACSGVMMPTSIATYQQWLTAVFWERLVLGSFTTFYSCRITSQQLQMVSAGELPVLGGSLTFVFESGGA